MGVKGFVGPVCQDAIRQKDLEKFKEEVRKGEDLNTQHLIAAVLLDSVDIARYIMTNYTLADKSNFIKIVGAQIGLREQFPSTSAMTLLLDYLSQLAYNNQRQFIFVNWGYKKFHYILQVKNEVIDGVTQKLNQELVNEFTKMMNYLESVGNDELAFLREMCAPLIRVTPMEQSANPFNDIRESAPQQETAPTQDALDYLAGISMPREDAVNIIKMKMQNRIKPVATSEKLEVLRGKASMNRENSFKPVNNVRPEDFACDIPKSTAKPAPPRMGSIPTQSIESKLAMAGISVQEVVAFVHQLEGR